MNKIREEISNRIMPYKIDKDKKKHFWVGIPLGMLLQFVTLYVFPAQHALSIGITMVLLIAGCYAFELFSLVTRKGHAEHLDAIAGIVGGMAGIAFTYIFIFVFNIIP
ncbi:MAG: hypothetical protein WKI04_04720 [Ferruginibacter sp.]